METETCFYCPYVRFGVSILHALKFVGPLIDWIPPWKNLQLELETEKKKLFWLPPLHYYLFSNTLILIIFVWVFCLRHTISESSASQVLSPRISWRKNHIYVNEPDRFFAHPKIICFDNYLIFYLLVPTQVFKIVKIKSPSMYILHCKSLHKNNIHS